MAAGEADTFVTWLDEWRAADAGRAVVIESTPSGGQRF
jgi:hypothetical protein